MTLPISIGPEIVLIASLLVVMLPALSEQYADGRIAALGAYVTAMYLAIETQVTLFRTIAYILIPLSFIYAGFIIYSELTQDGGSGDMPT